MLEQLPRRAFFRFEFPIRRMARLPQADGSLRAWSEDYLLPRLVELEDEDPFADVYAAWNEDGLAVAFYVERPRRRLECDPKGWWKKDGLRLCIDTRDARDVKRATRFCHFFYFLPVGGGNGRQPVAGIHRMSRAKEPPPQIDVARIQLGVHVDRDGYTLEAVIPASCLNGWDPAQHPRIGLFYKVKDVIQGGQHLTVTDELGWNADPSTWGTAVLVD